MRTEYFFIICYAQGSKNKTLCSVLERYYEYLMEVYCKWM